jgi:arginyl-tRNA synthetase
VIQDIIKKLIDDACETLGLPQANFVIEHPDNVDFGDFSTNIALVLSKQVVKNPRELANIILEEVKKNLPISISKAETAGPGFINFYLSKEFFALELKNILEKGEGYGTNKSLAGKKIILEYTNTNVLKPFHIGHLMGNILGESLSRVFEWSGAKVERVTYQGDMGLHIGKTIWGLMQKKDSFPKDTDSVSDKVKFVGEAYAYGSDQYEDNPESAEEIKIINKKAYDKDDEEVNRIYNLARSWSLEHFEEIYKILGTKFDQYFFESEVAEDALKIVNEYVEKGVFEKSDGAIVYKGEKFGLHTRVFVSSQGLPMYEAKDVAHAIRKYKDFPADESIIITANEQDDYFKVMLQALSEINSEVAGKTEHLSHGMLRMPEGKMSSRKGNVITGESLILETEEAVKEIIKDRELPPETKNQIAEFVAVSAIKYSVLRQAPGGNIIFDKSKAISFEGDSGPYLQYTAVRANSVLEKAIGRSTALADLRRLDADDADWNPELASQHSVIPAEGGELGEGPERKEGARRRESWSRDFSAEKYSGLQSEKSELTWIPAFARMTSKEIYKIEHLLYRFPEVVFRASNEKSPHYIVSYLMELASSFNGFYANNKIIEAGEESEYRLGITQAVHNILWNGLYLLGIRVPERM